MFAVFAGHGDVGGDDAAQLDDVGEVVLVPAVVVAGVRLEQVVTCSTAGSSNVTITHTRGQTCGQLESHAGQGPDVSGRAVPGS